MTKTLEIIATPFDEQNLCRFTLDKSLLEGGVTTIKKGENTSSELVQDLFEIDGLVEITVESNFLIARKNNDGNWREIGKSVGVLLRSYFDQGKLSFPVNEENLSKSSSDNFVQVNKEVFETVLGKKIIQVIELKISPSLGAHGGSVIPVDLKDGILFLSFTGGCQGCSQASVTVKDGILKILKDEFPEIRDVVDVTDHSLGSNPYFK